MPLGKTALRETGGGRYRGSLEVVPTAKGGLALINDLGFEDYVKGIAEVPGRWPTEALKAQAIAARTYALWEIGNGQTGEGKSLGYDICATTACQVYKGLENEGGAEGAAWAAAVESTRGRVVVHDDRPILARYHSTSGGRTRHNEDVFTSEGPRPYLKAVDSTDESGSSLYRWSVTFKKSQLEEALTGGGEVKLRGALTGLRSIRHPDGSGRPDEIVISGTEGDVTVRAGTFARVVSREAKKRWPESYPPMNPERPGTRLPDAVPSSTFSIRDEGESFVIDGSGWGHGVGMSQYGANGMALNGDSADEILKHYYTGTTIAARETGMNVRVLIGSGAETIPIEGSGEFRVEGPDGKVLAERALGKFTVKAKSKGTVTLQFPQNMDAPLALSGVASESEIATPAMSTLPITFTVSKPAIVTLEISRPNVEKGGSEVLYRSDEKVFEAGAGSLDWQGIDPSGSRAPAGAYSATVRARSVEGETSASVAFRIAEPADPSVGGEKRSVLPIALAVGLLLVICLVSTLGVLARRRARARNHKSADDGGLASGEEDPNPPLH